MNRIDESKELSPDSFSALSDEVILEILKHLDLKTLCLMNQVNKRFNNLTRDPLLYTRLNMQNISCRIYFYDILCYFTPRCEYLQQLDLAICYFSSSHFVQFLENCGRHLTHLRFTECRSVDNDVLFKISEICKNLKELVLTFLIDIEGYFDKEGISCLENLESLEILALETTKIEVQCLCKILQKNKGMRELYLSNCLLRGSYSKEECPIDTVAIELGNSCRDLQKIHLYKTDYITSKCINALADCKNLRIANLDTIMDYPRRHLIDDSLSRLLSSCQLLEEIYLNHIVFTDRNLKLLAECKNLKRLHLKYVEFVTPDNVSIILEQCSKLQQLVLEVHNISPYLINQWKKSHPHVLCSEKGVYM
ncbi:F-box/LRR-repeat protein 4-like [Temnothorax curvispinosus]|uniref:F-box/LRR-repeat protein 4-like n=1 Tax=Temnothorax curvispinosus TaxID=300111 RepID=A0A6J1PZQ0_9HYME|nr:F-box/LRR-repeat protein 4-like [Temnothorax curvispinosus]